MKKHLIILLFLSFTDLALGQTTKNACNCPTGQDLAHQGAPERMFTLSNGKQIGLCGDLEKTGRDTIYSEVILYHCGNEEEGFFRGWDGIKTCRIHQDHDTILVQQLFGLPVGENMKIITTTFKTEKYFYRGSEFVVHSTYRTDLKKYTPSQIANVLEQYTQLKPRDYDNILLVMRRLFWAYVSGSAEAGKDLESFEEKFGPFIDEKSDEFDEIHGLYWFWKLDQTVGPTELQVP